MASRCSSTVAPVASASRARPATYGSVAGVSAVGNQWKYVPLVRHLAALPAAQERVTLSLAAIEGLVGLLPVAAQQPPFWREATARRNWQRYGFRATLT